MHGNLPRACPEQPHDRTRPLKILQLALHDQVGQVAQRSFFYDRFIEKPFQDCNVLTFFSGLETDDTVVSHRRFRVAGNQVSNLVLLIGKYLNLAQRHRPPL